MRAGGARVAFIDMNVGVGDRKYYTRVDITADKVEEHGLYEAVQGALDDAKVKMFRMLDGKKEDGTLDPANT